jgi:hypothetical protein
MNTQPAFTNLQLELLKVFARQVSDEDVNAIRMMLSNYFADKAMNLADQVWQKNNWTEQDAINMMNQHHRKKHESSN